MSERSPALLLDRSYFPVIKVSWRKAFDLVYARQKAESIELYDESDDLSLSVIRLLYIDIPSSIRFKRPRFSKRNVLIRDEWRCLYCGISTKSRLTVDHVVPRCKGGGDTYTNCVAACMRCNNRKGDKTIEESGMILSAVPSVPVIGSTINVGTAPTQWQPFLKNYPRW